MAQDDPFILTTPPPTPSFLHVATAESQCPGCGEAIIADQRFCRKCGLALPTLSTQPEGQLIGQRAGAKESEAEALPSSAPTFQTSPGSTGAWWETPTVPVVQTQARDTVSSGVRRRRVWLSLLLLVVGLGSIGGYLVLHAQTQEPGRKVSSVGTPGANPTSGLAPTPTASPPVGSGYWHTSGIQIVDANNHPVRIAGLNWFGFESPTYVVHGLGQRDYHDLLRQIKSLGYNTIRIPFSDQLFFANSVPNGISFNNGMNQDLQGLNGLQILDKIVAASGQVGLRIILDHHGIDAGSQTKLWSAPDCSVSCFEADWLMLATHYLGNTTVIGADLDNEPHAAACWGCGNPSVDWQMEAQSLGNKILAINPHWLIFVEGVECYKGDCYWWGGNLEGVADTPVQLNVPNQVVYSPHDYPPDVYNLHYFNEPDYPDNLPGIWDAHWGFIVKEGIAPLMLGEFGTLLTTTKDQQWFTSIIAYLGNGVTGISWTYWALNPDSVDTGGILQNDWATVNQQKQDYLNPIEFPLV
jgi:aryl-phospho-beta-D-glucosidase BglC (GH1 family)